MVYLSDDFKQFLQFSSPTVVLDTDNPVFTIAFANDAYCEFTGLSFTDLIGKTFLDTFVKDSNDFKVKHAQQVISALTESLDIKKKTTLPVQRNDVYSLDTLKTGYFEISNTPVIDDGNNVSYILHQIIDITSAYEYAKKERLVFEVAEAKKIELEKFFMQAPAGLVIFDGPDFVFELVNPIYQSFFPSRELTGKPLLEALPELLGHPLVDGFRHTYATGETYYGNEVNTKLLREFGKPLDDSYWNFIGQARYDDQHRINGILMFGFEVTEQVLLRKKVEKSEERLNLAVENVESGVYDTDLITGKSIRSMRHAQIFGYPDNSGDWSLEQMIIHILPEDLDYAKQEHQKALEKGNINLQFRIKRLDGELRWINIIGRVNYNNKREPVRIVGTTTDITDKVALQRQKDEFISTVSHELKTPVTSIKAYGQLLKRSFKTSGDTTNEKFLEKMELQIGRLEVLIRNLLEVTRIESSKLLLHPEQLKLDSYVEDIISELQVIISTHQLTITNNEVSYLTADPIRLAQVITNLVTNAVKYSPMAKEVQIAIKGNNGSMICAIKDFGIGIPEKEQSLVFERFHQATHNNSNTGLSLGLGLYISKEIIEQAGGKIWVESEPGQGSIFYFSMPLAAADKLKLIME